MGSADISIAQMCIHLLDVRVCPNIQTLEAWWGFCEWLEHDHLRGCGGEKISNGRGTWWSLSLRYGFYTSRARAGVTGFKGLLGENVVRNEV